ncbi:MAG: hypothetical protein LBR06_06370, partial [Bacteroidales bacterium]|nr:hypothetical protein [Bacteroidales bacterium]
MKRYSRALAITGAGFSGPVSMAGAGRTTILLQRMALIVLLILTAAACGNKKSARKTDDNAFNTSSLRISGDGEQRISHPLVADDFIFKTVQQIDSTEFEGKKIRFDWQFTYCDNDFGGEPIDACLTNFCYTAFDKLFFNGFSNTTVDGI